MNNNPEEVGTLGHLLAAANSRNQRKTAAAGQEIGLVITRLTAQLPTLSLES